MQSSRPVTTPARRGRNVAILAALVAAPLIAACSEKMYGRPYPTATSNRRWTAMRIAALMLVAPLIAACSLDPWHYQGPVGASISSFSADPPEIYEGAVTRLVWNVYGQPEITTTIDHGIGVVPASGLHRIKPTSTTTYTLITTNRLGTDTATFTVLVHPPLEPDALEPDDDATSAIPIAPPYYSPLRTITPGDVDWYTFTIDGRAIVTVWLETESVGPALHAWYGILDANLMAVAFYGYGFVDDQPIALEAGTYYVAVTGLGDPPYASPPFDGSHQRAGTYRLVVGAVTE